MKKQNQFYHCDKSFQYDPLERDCEDAELGISKPGEGSKPYPEFNSEFKDAAWSLALFSYVDTLFISC